jgi:hypothetical protein
LLRFYLDVVLQVCSLSRYQCEPFFRLAFLGQGAVLNRRVSTFPQNVFSILLKTV